MILPPSSRSLLVVALGLLAACSAGASAVELEFQPGPAERLEDGAIRIRPESLPFIHVERLGDARVASVVRAPGRVAFREGAVSEVGAPVGGRVTHVHVRVGQRVEAGDELVSIASPSAAAVRAELARARVMVQAAEAEVARQREMAEGRVGIGSERVSAEASLAESRALLAGLSASAGSIGRGSAASVIVRAPIAGTILDRRASVGATVDAGGEPLVVIGEPGAVWIVAEVFERELPLVREGATAEVAISSVAAAMQARVISIGGAVDPTTRRAPVYLALDGADGGADGADGLRAGMYARASIEVSEGGIGIPTSAVLVKEGGRTVVYVARDERTFVARDVQIGAPTAGRAPVLAGLEHGEQIVVRGTLLLDGTADLLR